MTGSAPPGPSGSAKAVQLVKKPTMSDRQLHDLRHAFNMFDSDGSGTIDKQELRSVLKAMGSRPGKEELDELMSQMDVDKSGTIDFEEFVAVMADKLEDEELEKELEELAATFKAMDTDGSGALESEELRKALKRIGVVMTQEEVVYLMGMVDADGDGSVTYEEFVKFVLEYQIE